jgi:spore coat polysaccharide biosynthesis protein SpsF
VDRSTLGQVQSAGRVPLCERQQYAVAHIETTANIHFFLIHIFMSKKPRIIATVQVRMGSERLPGKALRLFAGKPMLAHLLDRVRLTKNLDGMVVATPESPENDAVEAFCSLYGVPCFRGSEDDVLGRMLGALESQHADIGVEVYGDSPLVDPLIIGECIETYLADSSYDWVGNDRTTTYSGGMDAEVFSVKALRDTARRTQDPAVREHGTLYLRQHPELYKLKDIEAQGVRRRPDICLEVDEKADITIIEEVLRYFSPRLDFTVEEIIAFLDEHTELATSNQKVFRRWKQYRKDSPLNDTTTSLSSLALLIFSTLFS